MDKNYIDFGVTPYALPAVLLALSDKNVHSLFVTLEDDDLHIRIDEEILKNVVYHIKPLQGELTSDKIG